MTRSGILKRTLVIALASVVILAGLLVGGVRLIDHLMPGYREALGERIGRRIDADVRIEGIELRWQWRGPLLELADVRVTRHGFEQPAIRVQKLGLHFSFAELIEGKRLPDSLVLDQPRLAVRRGEEGRQQIANWSRPGDPPLDWATVNDALALLRSVRINDAGVTLFDPSLPAGQARIDKLDASLARDGQGHAWQFDASGPDWFRKATGRGRFSGRLPGVDTADFKLSLQGMKPLTVAHATGLLDDDLAARLSGGELASEIEGRWAHQQLVDARAEIDTAALDDQRDNATLLPALSATLKAANIPASARPASGGDDFSFVVSDLRGDIDGIDRFSLSGAVDMHEPALRIDARHLPLAFALRLARLRYARLKQADIEAQIDDLTFALGADTPARLSFDFTGLAIDDPALTLGRIGGSYHQRAGVHRLRLKAANGTLEAQRYLRGALPLDDLGGELAWQRDHDAWQIDARKLTLTSQNAQITANGRVRLPRDGAPVLDIDAHASAPDAAALLQHVPQAADLPNERLRDWLPKAITAGALDSAHLQIAGAMDRFPFADARKNERFHMEMAGHGVNVDYKPGWPRLNNARGTLTLDGDDLRVDVASAQMLGIGLGAATGRIANVREPVLKIDGEADNARAEKMLAFLVESPLRDRFAKVVEALDVRGPADLALDLSIPLKPGLGDLEVAGDVRARGASLHQKALPGRITNINGKLHFDNDGLRAKGLKGNLLGVALSADVRPAPDKRQRIVARARLELPRDRAAVTRYLPDSWLGYANGATDFTVDLEVTRGGDVSDIDLQSDLAGMALNLPAPLAKPAQRSAPLAITVAGDASHVDIDYDQRLSVGVRQRDGHVRRVQALFNDANLQPPDRDGIWIGGRAVSANGLEWFKLVRQQIAAANRASDGDDQGLAFIGGDLRIGELNLGNRYLRNAQLRAQTMSATAGWRIDFEGPDTQGQVTWTQPAGGNINIAGNLARLAIHTRQQQPQAALDDAEPVIWNDADPRDLPHLDLFVKTVRVDGADFGHAEVKARALPDGWQLDRFQLEQGALEGWATGRWMRDSGLTRASAQTRFAGRGLSPLLRSLGYAATARAEDARVHARLNIAPNENGLDLRALDGSVDLALDNGTVTAVEPGAARVLGLFNLYVLPRRLRLDFRDVVDEGLAFDKVRAHFRIENGNAYSDNVRITTPSSKIHMSGRIGLAARDYDQRVTITPKAGSGVAIASTVFGGPLVGAAVFALQDLFKKPIEKFSRIAYTLKGSWDDPRIEQPSARE